MNIDKERLPVERTGLTRKFKLAKPPRKHSCPNCAHVWEENQSFNVYATVGLYPDGRPGELFISADKIGTTAHGVLDAVAIAISVGLQYGVPMKAYVDKLIGTNFGPSGFTGDAEFPRGTSILDLVAKWLRARFESKDSNKDSQ